MAISFDMLNTPFRLTLQRPKRTYATFAAADLVHRDKATAFIAYYRKKLRGLSDAAAVIYFANWFSQVILGHHYALSAYGEAVNLTPANLAIHFHANEEGNEPQLSFQMLEWRSRSAPTDPARRAAWREDALRAFYGGTVRPLYDSLAGAARLHVARIWEAMPFKIYDDRAKVPELGLHASMLEQIAEDLRYAAEGLQAERNRL